MKKTKKIVNILCIVVAIIGICVASAEPATWNTGVGVLLILTAWLVFAANERRGAR